jgi:uncharacterized protein (TIGR02147 family)
MFSLSNDPIEYLSSEFQNRQARRQEYSLRAFARDLNLSPSTLSELLNRKVGLSVQAADKLSKRMKLSDPHADHFVDLVASRHARSARAREEAGARANARMRSANSQMSLDKYRVVADWYHFAILELVDLHHRYHSAASLALALRIPVRLIEEGLSRLIQVGELIVSSDGWKTASASTTAGEDIASQALRAHHSQILQKAQHALEDQEVSTREYHATFLAIDHADLPEFKNELRRMRRELIKKFGQKPGRDRLYCLSTQLFRIDEDLDA